MVQDIYAETMVTLAYTKNGQIYNASSLISCEKFNIQLSQTLSLNLIDILFPDFKSDSLSFPYKLTDKPKNNVLINKPSNITENH